MAAVERHELETRVLSTRSDASLSLSYARSVRCTPRERGLAVITHAAAPGEVEHVQRGERKQRAATDLHASFSSRAASSGHDALTAAMQPARDAPRVRL